jgi:amino-acid N-acetyltransferase
MESKTSQIIIREAGSEDLKAIKFLLESVSLPSVDIEKHLFNFFVMDNGEDIIGTIGIEYYGDIALLRSLAVKIEYQNKCYGQKLCHKLIYKAEEMDVNNMYLLTNTAEEFFSREGFQKILRESVPPAIKQTYEYSTLCPSDSICMVKRLKVGRR